MKKQVKLIFVQAAIVTLLFTNMKVEMAYAWKTPPTWNTPPAWNEKSTWESPPTWEKPGWEAPPNWENPGWENQPGGDSSSWETPPNWNKPKWDQQDSESDDNHQNNKTNNNEDKPHNQPSKNTSENEHPSNPNKTKFSFEQKIGHIINDIVDDTTDFIKDGIDKAIEGVGDLANKTVDLGKEVTDFAIDSMNSITTGITNTAESIRYNVIDSLIKASEFASSDNGDKLLSTSPLNYGIKKALQALDTEMLTEMNEAFHQQVNKFIDIKDLGFNVLKEKSNSLLNGLKSFNGKIEQKLKDMNRMRDDLSKIIIKSNLDYMNSYFDFSPSARPYGTINDVNIDSKDLMAFADLAYIKNENQWYETSKRMQTTEDYIPKDFIEAEDFSTSDIAGFSGKTFVNEDEKKVVIAFRGTEPDEDMRDLYADLALVFGMPNPQHSEAKELTRKVLENYQGYEIVIVGHSLGGNLAQEVGRHYKIPTATFNAPGMQMHKDAVDSYPRFLKNRLDPDENANYSRFINRHNEKDKYNDLIINHIMANDEIGNLGIHIGTTIIYDIDESGNLKIYESDDFGSDQIKKDRFENKIPSTIRDFKEGTIHHGIDNFKPYLEDGVLRRKEEE